MKNALLNTLAWLTGASRTLVALLLPVFRSSLSAMLTALAPIAIEVVASLADSGKSGAEKRAAAVDAIRAQALQVGIAATASAVNLAVELAVAHLKEGKE
jgi:hypothetical protein